MADKNLWSNYTEKDTLTDKDEVMIYDSVGKTNKRSLMEKFWDYIVEKMATAVISKLETENKTVIGALNYLNGKSLSTMYNANTNRADTQNRKDAINTLIQQMYQKGNTISLGMVRYLGGYYYSYIIISWGTNSLNITILEYSMHVPETYIWGAG